MGEIAEMMLEGILCQSCGVYIDEGEAQGFPRTCDECKDYMPGPKRFKGRGKRKRVRGRQPTGGAP
jgi:hypothetical protein